MNDDTQKQEENIDQNQEPKEVAEVDEKVKKTEKKQKNKDEELKDKILGLEDQLKRTIADYRNLQKRSEDAQREIVKFANRQMLLDLFPAFDTLFLAEKHIEDPGLKLTVKMLRDTFEKIGITKIETEGKTYDPEGMECIATEDGEEGKVILELRPGFMMYGKVLRPAQVKVGKKN